MCMCNDYTTQTFHWSVLVIICQGYSYTSNHFLLESAHTNWSLRAILSHSFQNMVLGKVVVFVLELHV